MNFKCKVCDQCYKGLAAFRIHSLDVHSIDDPELGKLLMFRKDDLTLNTCHYSRCTI